MSDPGRYVAENPGEFKSFKEVADFLEREFQRVEQGTRVMDIVRFDTLNVEPAKPRAGMVARADGTNWDPGGGEGLYEYISAAIGWRALFSSTRSVVLTLDDYRKGVTAPTDATVGSTPTIPVLLFNATNELLSLHTVMPIDWDKSKDCSVDFVWSLSSNESNNDVLSVTIDYVAVKKNTTGAGIAKTSTALTPTTTVTTANGLAIGDIYTMSAILAQDDSNNGFAAGDDTTGFCLEFHLTNTTGVADIHFVGGCINYSPKY